MIFFGLVLLYVSGCVEDIIDEEKLKGLADVKVDSQIGLNNRFKFLEKMADSKFAGDDAGRDIFKKMITGMRNYTDAIHNEIIGRDKWDLSGGGIYAVACFVAQGIFFVIFILALMSFIKALAIAIYVRREVKPEETKTMANKVKTQTQNGFGIIKRLGGWVGDKIIKFNKINALAK